MAVQGQTAQGSVLLENSIKCAVPNLIMGISKGETECGIKIPKDLGVGEGAELISFIKMQWFG